MPTLSAAQLTPLSLTEVEAQYQAAQKQVNDLAVEQQLRSEQLAQAQAHQQEQQQAWLTALQHSPDRKSVV